MTLDLIALLPTALVTLLWYLYKQKDDRTTEALKLLWQRHDEDALALQELRVHIASEHYKKLELDTKFVRLEDAITKGNESLGKKFDHLADILTAHVMEK